MKQRKREKMHENKERENKLERMREIAKIIIKTTKNKLLKMKKL